MTADKHVSTPFGYLPPPDVVDFLVRQHLEIRDLLGTVMTASGEERRTAFAEVVRLLAIHETAEEEAVHPVVRGATDGGQGIIDDRIAEEHDAKVLLQQLDGMDTDDEAFLPLFLQLRQAVITHALSEQRYEFNRIRQHLGTPQRATMRMLVKVAEATAPTHPHPGVESATANLVLGPMTAVVDRTRDAIRAARESGK